MKEYEAVTLTAIKSSNVDTSGQFAIFECEAKEGGPFNFAVPEKELATIIELASAASGQAQRILKKDPTARHVLPTEYWNVGVSPRTGNVVVSFRLPGGLELSFAVARDAAQALQAGISEVLRQPVVKS